MGPALDLAGFAHLVHSAAASGSDKGGQPGNNSATAAMPVQYLEWVQSGLHVVTPNKKFMSGPLARYQQLQALCAASGRQFKYEEQ
ncbi:homoserine dehydrogenase [Haematococcus lacustris]|uniref:Homoserine dehydrogenase n=1 Tax=Haematococcus lacustris TaxID=44745 RepID=A0A699ZUE1_HAELA|nr:homoserine dehydrogenase [Haematococcus lacustris]